MVVTPHKRWNTEFSNGSGSDDNYLAEEEGDIVPAFLRKTV
jgi:hypothetical protein